MDPISLLALLGKPVAQEVLPKIIQAVRFGVSTKKDNDIVNAEIMYALSSSDVSASLDRLALKYKQDLQDEFARAEDLQLLS